MESSPAFRHMPLRDIASGVGSFDSLAEELSGAVTLVADAGVLDVGIGDSAIDTMSANADVQIVPVPQGEPTIETVDHVASQLAGGARTVVTVGGGSALDTAKLAAAAATLECSTRDFLEGKKPLANHYEVIALPTTSGTGAEVTQTAVVSDGGRKTWAWGDALRPHRAVLDPRLTLSCPPGVTVAAGIDALVHAFEAATGQRREALAIESSKEAVRLITTHLAQIAHDGSDLDGRAELQIAATLAGTAIDTCGTGIAHAIGHAISTVHGTPHGIAVGLGLRATIEWNLAAAAEPYEPLALAMKSGATTTDLPNLLDELFGDVGFAALASQTMPEDLAAAPIAAAMRQPENRPMQVNSSRVPTSEDVDMVAEITVRTWNRFAGLGEPAR